MTDINKKVIELIGQNRSIKEIANILNISERQLYVRIKQIIKYGYRCVIFPIFSEIFITFN